LNGAKTDVHVAMGPGLLWKTGDSRSGQLCVFFTYLLVSPGVYQHIEQT